MLSAHATGEATIPILAITYSLYPFGNTRVAEAFGNRDVGVESNSEINVILI